MASELSLKAFKQCSFCRHLYQRSCEYYLGVSDTVSKLINGVRLQRQNSVSSLVLDVEVLEMSKIRRSFDSGLFFDSKPVVFLNTGKL